MKSSKAIYKYSKITPQKKFHLLTLVLNEKMLIKNVFLFLLRQQKSLESTIPQPKPFYSSTGMGKNPTSLSSKTIKKSRKLKKNTWLPSWIYLSTEMNSPKLYLPLLSLTLSALSAPDSKPFRLLEGLTALETLSFLKKNLSLQTLRLKNGKRPKKKC